MEKNRWGPSCLFRHCGEKLNVNLEPPLESEWQHTQLTGCVSPFPEIYHRNTHYHERIGRGHWLKGSRTRTTLSARTESASSNARPFVFQFKLGPDTDLSHTGVDDCSTQVRGMSADARILSNEHIAVFCVRCLSRFWLHIRATAYSLPQEGSQYY